MSENILVPDGITPVVAWRGWCSTKRAGGLFYTVSFLTGDAPRVKRTDPEPTTPPARLHSTNHGDEWPGLAPIEAKCEKTHLLARHSEYDARRGEHFVNATKGVRIWSPREYCPEKAPVPQKDCTCGIYGVQSREDIPSNADIIGRVALWGTVVVGDKGWRAQFAYPQALYVPDEKFSEWRGQLMGRYGVPVMRQSAIADTRVFVQ